MFNKFVSSIIVYVSIAHYPGSESSNSRMLPIIPSSIVLPELTLARVIDVAGRRAISKHQSYQIFTSHVSQACCGWNNIVPV